MLITVRLYQDVDHVAVLIHGTPLRLSGIARTELLTPDPNRFIGDDDSAFGEKILDISEAQAEAMVSPDRIADDLGRKTIAAVTRPIALSWHQSFSSVPKLTMPRSKLTERSCVNTYP